MVTSPLVKAVSSSPWWGPVCTGLLCSLAVNRLCGLLDEVFATLRHVKALSWLLDELTDEIVDGFVLRTNVPQKGEVIKDRSKMISR